MVLPTIWLILRFDDTLSHLVLKNLNIFRLIVRTLWEIKLFYGLDNSHIQQCQNRQLIICLENVSHMSGTKSAAMSS